MKRDLQALANQTFDLVVIGGGIFGACAALDAAQRGLRVALIERGDLCGATSAHSFKMIHGGIRYLQHADFYRVRQSAAARRAFFKMTPHLTHPLPIVIPTYGQWGVKSKMALKAGMAVYDALTFDRNRGIEDPSHHLPNGWSMPLDEVRTRYPGLDRDGLTGAGVFCDGQMHNPPRLVLAIARSAFEAGAVIANYTEATGFVVRAGRIVAIQALDHVTGDSIDIKTSMVLNAAGPYVENLITQTMAKTLKRPTPFSRDTYFIVNRPLLDGGAALTIPSKTGDPHALISRGRRHLFLVPWQGATLVGVWHHINADHPDDFAVTEAQLLGYLDEINQAYQGLDLSLDDISLVNAGLVPFGENDPAASDLKFAHRSRLIDHGKQHGLEGLVSLIGVRYTTGPLDAPKAIDLLAKHQGWFLQASTLTERPAYGGEVGSMARLVQETEQALPSNLPVRCARALARNHGVYYGDVLDFVRDDPNLGRVIQNSNVLAAEVAHAVTHEMALTLADVVFRRTDLGTAAPPSADVIEETATIMARMAGWTVQRRRREVALLAQRVKAAKAGRMSLCDRPNASFQTQSLEKAPVSQIV